jgi:tetrapyrrole methylase family protein/MazG family protein
MVAPGTANDTPSTLISSLIEETFESADAIANSDTENIMEELGDILMVVIMISTIYEEVSLFTTLQVISEINRKLVRRHPHVFDNIRA